MRKLNNCGEWIDCGNKTDYYRTFAEVGAISGDSPQNVQKICREAVNKIIKDLSIKNNITIFDAILMWSDISAEDPARTYRNLSQSLKDECERNAIANISNVDMSYLKPIANSQRIEEPKPKRGPGRPIKYTDESHLQAIPATIEAEPIAQPPESTIVDPKAAQRASYYEKNKVKLRQYALDRYHEKKKNKKKN